MSAGSFLASSSPLFCLRQMSPESGVTLKVTLALLCCVMRRNNVVHPGVALVFPRKPNTYNNLVHGVIENGKITGVFENYNPPKPISPICDSILSITPSKFYTNYNNTV